jgi:glycosyltransferase involved in cell wall biosynthesis
MLSVTYIGNFLSEHGLNPTYSEALVPELSRCGLNVRSASGFENPLLRMMDMLFSIWRTPRSNACIILDLYSGPRAFVAGYLLSLFARVLRKPYIVVLHGGNLPNRLSTSHAKLNSILLCAKRVVSPSRYLADTFAGQVLVDVIPNALSVQDYQYKLRSPAAPNFLYLRAFHKNYDPITAIKAFAIVQGKYPKAHLSMLGPDLDGTFAQCISLVDRLKLRPQVALSGRIPKSEIPKLSEKHDIFINSTSVDNTPVSVVEAMAMGMCIVATTVGGLPFLLSDGETALLVDPGDEQKMAAAMMRLIEEPILAGKLSENARHNAEQMDWSRVVPKWLTLIQSVATVP